MLPRSLLTVLAIICVVLCAQMASLEISSTEIDFLAATWIIIEILGFIKESSKVIVQISSTKSANLGATSLFSDLSMTPQEEISSSSTTKSVDSVARSSLARLDTNSQHLSMRTENSGTRTDASKIAIVVKLTRITRAIASAIIDSISGQRFLASVFSLSAVPTFYTSGNSTNVGAGNESTLGITWFSQSSSYTTSSNMSIFTGFGKLIYLNLPRYILLLASALPLILLVIVWSQGSYGYRWTSSIYRIYLIISWNPEEVQWQKKLTSPSLFWFALHRLHFLDLTSKEDHVYFSIVSISI